jgi:hypothetical protein
MKCQWLAAGVFDCHRQSRIYINYGFRGNGELLLEQQTASSVIGIGVSTTADVPTVQPIIN